LIWHELRRLGEEKPLIASVGDMAASGGYYLASAAEQIWAERTSVIGSIGVLGGKFTMVRRLPNMASRRIPLPRPAKRMRCVRRTPLRSLSGMTLRGRGCASRWNRYTPCLSIEWRQAERCH